ncbi:MAG: hypothetical protein ACAH83_08955 [Alphaproteobacteria bacterium]
MAFLPPQLKLALVFAQVAKNYGPILMHSNNVDLLTKDLGTAMKKQKDILSDPKKGMIMTSYDVLPVIMEVKILSSWVASKLEIDTKGKSTIAVLDEIVQKTEERNKGKYAKDIKDSLEWTRNLFSHPEIQDVLKMEMTEVEKPSSVSIKGLTKFFSQLAGRSQDELTRLNEFLKRAKEVQEKDSAPKTDVPKAEPQANDATPPAAEAPKPPKPDAPKP